MDRIIRQYLEGKGLQIERNSAYGEINGYEVNVFQKIPMQATDFSIVMTVSCFVEEAKRQELEAALRNLLTKW